MKKAFRKSLKRQSSLGGYFRNSLSSTSRNDTSPSCGTPILWQALARKYQFNYPKDWYKIEAHWLDQIESFQEQPIDCPGRDGQMNNSITRISQCNESYQLCNSLPRSFIVPKDLKDVILIDTLSTIIRNHRVPVITYCCPIEYRRNFIIRCASASSEQHHERVIETIKKAVKPLEVFNLDYLAPSSEKLDRAYKKLHDVCRRSDDDNQSNTNFLSRSGKWLHKVSQTLKLVNKTAYSLLTQASVILIEDEDRGWNCVVSSLVQLILEPHRRTIEGFESLLSKEWIYLTGGQPMIDQPFNQAQQCQQQPNILFDLFLDCTYQMYLQNPSEFEFTSNYLKYLFDSQHTSQAEIMPSSSNGNYNNQQKSIQLNDKLSIVKSQQQDGSSHSSYRLANRLNRDVCSIDALRLFDSGKTKMLNPVYCPDKDSPILKIYDHVANMRLWSSQYLERVIETNNINNNNNNDVIINNNNNNYT